MRPVWITRRRKKRKKHIDIDRWIITGYQKTLNQKGQRENEEDHSKNGQNVEEEKFCW